MAAFIRMFKSMNLRYQLSSMISMYDNFNGETAKKWIQECDIETNL